MIEILGTELTENALIGDAVGAFVGALIVAYALYVVAKVKHESEIIDEKKDALLAGAHLQSWRAEKIKYWYKGYKLALVECLALGTLFGAGAGILGAHLGWVHGAIELGALAGLAAIVSGLLLDTYVIHPIADNNFQKDVEFPLVQKFLGIATDIAEVSDEDLKKIALELKKQGKL